MMIVLGVRDVFIFTNDNLESEMKKFENALIEFDIHKLSEDIRAYIENGFNVKIYIGDSKDDNDDFIPMELHISSKGSLWRWQRI